MDTDDIDKQSAAVSAMAVSWPVIDALVGGTQAMRQAATRFLPQWPAEDDESYKDRLATAVLFPAFGRTTEVLAAKPFARPIHVQGVSARVEGMFENIDMLGTDLHAFCGQIMLACLRHGLHGVLVDTPRADGAPRTLADEKRAGIRPYFTHYPCGSILGWRAERSADGMFLTQLRLLEEVSEPKGRFGEDTVQQVRVLEPGKWEIWRRVAGAKAGQLWELFDTGTTTIKPIPFVFFYGLREGYGIGKPPLLELAHMNVEHWQSSSDQQTILHVARVPILVAKGFANGDKVTVGAKALTNVPKEAGLEYVEHSGAAIEAGRQSIHDLEDRMREIGAELLTERQGEVTAQQVNSEDEDNRSTLQKIAEEFEDSLESCLQLMGLWVGEKSAPEVEVYKDFGIADAAGKSGDLLAAAGQKIISHQTVREAFMRTGQLPHDHDEDEEIRRLTAENEQALKDQAARAKLQAGNQATEAAP